MVHPKDTKADRIASIEADVRRVIKATRRIKTEFQLDSEQEFELIGLMLTENFDRLRSEPDEFEIEMLKEKNKKRRRKKNGG